MSQYKQRCYLHPAQVKTPSAITVKKSFYPLIFLLFISPALIVHSAMGVAEFYRLKNMHQVSASELEELKTNLDRQKDEIVSQQDRIREYSETITRQDHNLTQYSQELQTFQAKLADLTALEKQIRDNIRDMSVNEGFSGKGGGSSDQDMPKQYRKDLSDQLKLLDQAIAERKQSFENIQKYLTQQRRLLAATPSLCPIKGVKTSGFGYRLSPFTGVREFHRGLDVASPIGTPIRATGDGKIITIERTQSLGNHLEIDHGNGIVTRYGHIDKFVKKRGDWVKKGDIVARVGNTGRSTGPHLHYEVILNGVPVDPEIYISRKEKAAKLKQVYQ